jgi:thiamine kinase-like enzyme
MLNGYAYKIYEAQNLSQAVFIKELANDSDLSSFLPKCELHNNKFIKAEWVTGNVIQDNKLVDVVKLLKQIHYSEKRSQPSYDFVLDYIIPRFEKVSAFASKFIINSAISCIRDYENELAFKISHPDLSCSNIILDTSNQMKIIDNELLGISKHYNLDVLNLLYNSKQTVKNDILVKVKKLNLLQDLTDKKYLRYLESLWLSRICGSLMLRQNNSEIEILLYKYFNNDWILPFNKQ